MKIRTPEEMVGRTPKRMKGMHAQGIVSLDDALGKLGSGKLTPQEFGQLQTLVGKHYGVLGGLSMMPPMPAPPQLPLKVR
jgi:hypothetical protein